MNSATSEWKRALEIVEEGWVVSPRRQLCIEVLNHTSVIDMKKPKIVCPPRKLGQKFQYAEAAWILSGDNRVKTIAPYASAIKDFSDDGKVFAGAYGPPIAQQLKYVLETLIQDPYSRQAVLTIWKRNPLPSKDIPCTVSAQFIIRENADGINELHCIDNMRSSDVWLGWPYDVFNFSMLSTYILIELNKVIFQGQLKLGTLYLNAGSQHVYEKNLKGLEECLNWFDTSCFNIDNSCWECTHFNTGDELIDYLWEQANS